MDLSGLAGKVIAHATQERGDFHALDGGYEQDGPVVLTFTDGARLTVEGYWCNDRTASTEYELTPAEPDSS